MKSTQQPNRRGTCDVCGGSMTYYPRRSEDSVPRSCAVDDAQRWSHDVVADWISRPHRARPSGAPAAGGVRRVGGSGRELLGAVGGAA